MTELTLTTSPMQMTEIKKISAPFFLRWRCSSAFITTTISLGVLVDTTGYGIILPTIPYILSDLGYDETGSRTGILVSAYACGLILSTPIIAYVGERFKGKRVPLIITVQFMAVGLILFITSGNYSLMILARFLQGISGTGIWSLGLAMITDSIPSERMGTVMGKFFSTSSPEDSKE